MTVSNLITEVAESGSGFIGNDRKLIPAKLGDKVFDQHARIFAQRKGLVKNDLCKPSIPLEAGMRLNSFVNKYQNRKQWLRNLQEKEGSKAQLASKIGTDPNYISSILGPNAKRNIGDDLARRIEEIYHLPEGALDLPSKAAHDLVKAIEGLNDKDFDDILAFIRFKKASKH